MPPRVPLFSAPLRALNGHGQICRGFASTSVEQASTVQQKRRHRDPYAILQARARKTANQSRQAALKQERTAGLGDPVRGITTPFVQSFDTAMPLSPKPSQSENLHTATRNESSSPDQPPAGPNAQNESYMNFYLNQDEIKQAVSRSQLLTQNVQSDEGRDIVVRDAETEKNMHNTATEALNRIVSLANASSKDLLRVNIQRCISTFGRHRTDAELPSKPLVAESISARNAQANPQKTERAGPDTGSSEVQIAILTAKIRTLADFLESRGRPDKINKRNLTILVHKRQKLLSYLRRKERGGPRWQNLIETLGLTEGTWRGEISLR